MSDLIVREDAIKALRHVFSTCDPCCREEAVDIAVTTVEAIPSARPKGEWISEGRTYPPTNAYHSAYCSHCGEWSEYLTDYCGNCGADMRKDEPQTECDNDCPYRVDGLGCMRLGGCYKESE